MNDPPAVLDTDTLSEISRGHPRVRERAARYLAQNGRLTITTVTVFERLRGYQAVLRKGKPIERHLQAFQALAASCLVLPLDREAAEVAAEIWGAASRAQRQQLGDLLIAAIAVSRRMPLVTRNRRDFDRLLKAAGLSLDLLDWAAPLVARG